MAHHGEHHIEHGHILPFRLYVTVLVTLLILTIITVAISRVDFGNWNIVVAMVIASIKAGIVALFFMHLKYESPLTWLYVAIPLFLLAVMLAGIFIDDPFRRDAKSIGGAVKIVEQAAPVAAPAHEAHH